MAEIKNPFLVEGYAGDKYFCDREAETATLLQALASRRNVTLISPRRMGKSGLIMHAFEKAKRDDKSIKCFYIDLFHTHSLTDLINAFASAVFGALDSPIEKVYKTIASVFKRCRPVITPDNVTGAPSISLEIDPGQENHTLKEIFEYLKQGNRPIYIAFDEFQQIAEYPEAGVEGLLRSFIQFAPSISFVFAGSKKHMMQEMFTLPSRPFYQSTQTLALKPIPVDSYFFFAERLFNQAGIAIEREAFEHIYNSVYGHTWYVQYWLSRIYDLKTGTIGIDQANTVLANILQEEDDNFYTYSKLVTPVQLRALRGIAKAGILSEPYSASTASAYGLPAASSMRSAVKTLLDKEMIVEERGEYSIYNRYFMHWLRM